MAILWDTDRVVPIRPLYRIALVVDGSYYWTGRDWSTQADARLYTREERELSALPFRGCWEVAQAPILYEMQVRR